MMTSFTRSALHALGVAATFIFCAAVQAELPPERLARWNWDFAKSLEGMHQYPAAISSYKEVIAQAPGSALARRAQERIDRLRATPEMIAAEKKQAEQRQKEAQAREAAKKRLEEYVQAHPEYRSEILSHQIILGMSQDDVITSWGKPEHVNTTVAAYGRREQWIYGSQYVYFEDGRVSAIQSSR